MRWCRNVSRKRFGCGSRIGGNKRKQITFNETTCNPTIDLVRKWVDDALIAARTAMLGYCDENQTKGSSTIALLAFANKF